MEEVGRRRLALEETLVGAALAGMSFGYEIQAMPYLLTF
jgi:hypothetical protein